MSKVIEKLLDESLGADHYHRVLVGHQYSPDDTGIYRHKQGVYSVHHYVGGHAGPHAEVHHGKHGHIITVHHLKHLDAVLKGIHGV